MDITHARPGDLNITIDQFDVNDLLENGYCMTRDGLIGRESKSWVRLESGIVAPYAELDGASDVYVQIGEMQLATLPIRIHQEEINPYMDTNRGRVDFYFGRLGGITLGIR